jgi:transcriptional regulator with XRE-family HTH domain
MKDATPGLNHRIAGRVRDLRAAGNLSLDALATRSGVSRSMISVIERGESSPTAVVLEKLAAGLGGTLAALFDAPAGTSAPDGPVARRDQQPEWQDPASGYRRRNVSPPGVPQPMQIVEVHFPPGARVFFDEAMRAARVYEQIGMLREPWRSRWAPRVIGCGKATASRWKSITRRSSTTRRGTPWSSPPTTGETTMRPS